jgi:hypothetical protein
MLRNFFTAIVLVIDIQSIQERYRMITRSGAEEVGDVFHGF